jgi:hypothetical protein
MKKYNKFFYISLTFIGLYAIIILSKGAERKYILMKKEHLIWGDSYKEIGSIAKSIANENNNGEVTDSILEEAERINADYLDDERANLNIPTENEIVVIADLGLWNGRRMAYKLLKGNVSNCLYFSRDGEGGRWYCHAYNLLGEEYHHDGTNYYTYRERRSDISYDAWKNFLNKLYDGTATKRDISRYTKSLLPYVKEAYGW